MALFCDEKRQISISCAIRYPSTAEHDGGWKKFVGFPNYNFDPSDGLLQPI